MRDYRRTERMLKKASKKSPYVIIDNQPGRSDMTDGDLIQHIRQFFERRPGRIEEVIFIGLDDKLQRLKK